MSDLMSDGFVEAKRVYISLLIACLASYVLSTENRKKLLRRAPSRANRIEPSFELSRLTPKKRTRPCIMSIPSRSCVRNLMCAESFRSQQ